MHAAAIDFVGPTNADLVAPVSTMGDSPIHNARRVRANALVAIGQLRAIASAEWDLPVAFVSEQDAEQVEALRDFWMGYLDTVRHVQKQLADGIAVRRFRHEVRRSAADLVKPLDEAIAGAIESCRQIRAYHLAMHGGQDADVADVEVLPPAPDAETHTPLGGKSVEFEW